MSDDEDWGLNDPELRVFYSVYGLVRFDAAAVADALRNGKMTPMQSYGLANLIEGKHPQGLSLKIQGQGKGWKPAAEVAARYKRSMRVGDYITHKLAAGDSVEQAVIDASMRFGVSEPTIYRDLAMYRLQADLDS